MELTVVVQNLGTGGIKNADGDLDDRWPLLAERINGAAGRVDIVLLQEAADWHLYGHKQLARACRDLDLDALPLAPSRSGLGTAILYRREVLGRWVRWNTDFAGETLHGFGIAGFDVGLSAPLAFTSVHLTPFDADAALSEANLIATRGYKYGPFAVLAGDCNFPPASSKHPAPDFAAMRPYNIASRTLPLDGDLVPIQDLEPDRRVARKLVHNGYVDVAWHLHRQSGDLEPLRPTGTDDRIDQAWVSGPLAPAVSGYRLLDSPTGASDPHGIAFRLDVSAIDTTDAWTYR